MKRLIALAAALLITTTAFAGSSPVPPWFHAIAPDVFLSNATSAQEGHFVKKVARFFFDYSLDGAVSGSYGLGVKLPARAIIVRSYFKVITGFTDSGATTVAFQCEDANNIYSAADIAGGSDNAFIEGASTGASTAFKRAIGADCEITGVVQGAANNYLTAGKAVGFVEYLMEN